MSRPQADLFAAAPGEPQPDLFGPAPASPAYRPDLDKVRRRLERIVGEARAAASMPWDWAKLSLYRTIVPQMALWLPEEEAAQWRLDFEQELERLEAA